MIRITSNFSDITLNDQNEGRRQFFSKVMNALDEQDFAVFKIGVKMPEGAGGFFQELLAVDSINLPEGPSFEDNKLTFQNEHEFAVFVHEACHFLHLVVDEGRRMTLGHTNEVFTQDMIFNDRNGSIRREIEFEAGYRSVFYDKVYKMFPGDRTILDLNLANMLSYDIKKQKLDIRKALKKMSKPGEKMIDVYKPVIDKVQKFSEWTDANHEILL